MRWFRTVLLRERASHLVILGQFDPVGPFATWQYGFEINQQQSYTETESYKITPKPEAMEIWPLKSTVLLIPKLTQSSPNNFNILTTSPMSTACDINNANIDLKKILNAINSARAK